MYYCFWEKSKGHLLGMEHSLGSIWYFVSDESSKYLMKNHKEMLSHYSVMYDNMMKINSTVSHLLTTVNSMQEHLDERINWFSHLLNLAGKTSVPYFFDCNTGVLTHQNKPKVLEPSVIYDGSRFLGLF